MHRDLKFLIYLVVICGGLLLAGHLLEYSPFVAGIVVALLFVIGTCFLPWGPWKQSKKPPIS